MIRLKALLPFASSLAMLLGGSLPVFAEIPPLVGTVTHVFGTATLQHGLEEEAKPVHFRDKVYLKDTIKTDEESVVRVLMGNRALVTVGEMSVLTITEEVNHATLDIESGSVELSVARKRMGPGEYIEIRTPHAVAAIRGTKLVAQVANKHSSRFSVIEGQVDEAYHVSDPKNRIPIFRNQVFEFNKPQFRQPRINKFRRKFQKRVNTNTVVKKDTLSDLVNCPSEEGAATNHINQAAKLANRLTQQLTNENNHPQVAYAPINDKTQSDSHESGSPTNGESQAASLNQATGTSTSSNPSTVSTQKTAQNIAPAPAPSAPATPQAASVPTPAAPQPSFSAPSAPATPKAASVPTPVAPQPSFSTPSTPKAIPKAPPPPAPIPKIVSPVLTNVLKVFENDRSGRRGGDDDRRRKRRGRGRDD